MTDDVIRCRCGSESFELRRVDEFETDGVSVYAFCAGCGNTTGKMFDRTVSDFGGETDR